MSEKLLEVKNLLKYYTVPQGTLHAVDGVSFSINKGETLGLVGESGCGKSTIGRTILRLIPHTGGEVLYNGEDILKYNPTQMRELRKEMQIIFQDPYSCLDPRKTISQIIAEPLIVNKMCKRSELNEVVIELKYSAPVIISDGPMSLLSNNSSISDEVTGGGRGTRVVSTVLYPRTVPSDGVYQLPCWIRNMRILDENNCHQEMCIRQRQ